MWVSFFNLQHLIFFCKFLKLHDNFQNQVIYVKWVFKTDFDDHFALHSTAAAVRQHMTQRHDHIVQAVMVVDGCGDFAIMTSGHILIAKRGLRSINLIQWHIILKARHLSTL